MTILEAIQMNCKRNKLEREIQQIKNQKNSSVCVYDFSWVMLGKCCDSSEAAKVYELPRELVVQSMLSGGRKIISGLRFRRKAR